MPTCGAVKVLCDHSRGILIRYLHLNEISSTACCRKDEIFEAIIVDKHPYKKLLPVIVDTEGETMDEFLGNGGRLGRVMTRGVDACGRRGGRPRAGSLEVGDRRVIGGGVIGVGDRVSMASRARDWLVAWLAISRAGECEGVDPAGPSMRLMQRLGAAQEAR
mgnify:CR=1 FL=1